MDPSLILYGLAGLIALIVGAEALVRGASSLAQRLGVSPLVVGLTVVAFGTSAPELAVSLSGQSDVAVGNALGSNLFNTLVILGISALATPLVVAQQLVRREVPLMIGVTAVVMLMALDGEFVRWEGLVLFGGFIVYTLYALVQSRKSTADIEAAYDDEFGAEPKKGALGIALEVAGVLGGLVLLVFGSRWFVSAAIDLARLFEVSETVISLTIVAAGTSMPELATSVMASIRGKRDIAVGNVVGSNIFNLLVVLGLTASIAPGIAVDPGVVAFDLPLLLAVSIASLPIFFSGHVIDRWEGAIFLLYYIAYATYLVLTETAHSALEPFSVAMFAFVIPVTVLTLGIILYRSYQRA